LAEYLHPTPPVPRCMCGTCSPARSTPSSSAASTTALCPYSSTVSLVPRHNAFTLVAEQPGLHVPLSTLRHALAGRRRMTRGRRGSLALRRRALTSPPPCRFIPRFLPVLVIPLTGDFGSGQAACPCSLTTPPRTRGVPESRLPTRLAHTRRSSRQPRRISGTPAAGDSRPYGPSWITAASVTRSGVGGVDQTGVGQRGGDDQSAG
jgi:hypothetical protein